MAILRDPGGHLNRLRTCPEAVKVGTMDVVGQGAKTTSDNVREVLL